MRSFPSQALPNLARLLLAFAFFGREPRKRIGARANAGDEVRLAERPAKHFEHLARGALVPLRRNDRVVVMEHVEREVLGATAGRRAAVGARDGCWRRLGVRTVMFESRIVSTVGRGTSRFVVTLLRHAILQGELHDDVLYSVIAGGGLWSLDVLRRKRVDGGVRGGRFRRRRRIRLRRRTRSKWVKPRHAFLRSQFGEGNKWYEWEQEPLKP